MSAPATSRTATRDRLLDAAEALYSENGIAGASLRSITARAGANLAAVHYHFGSKEALTEEVFARRLGPLNRERLARLDEIEADAAGAAVAPEEILRAFLVPALRMSRDPDSGGERFVRLMARMYSEPGIFDDRFIPHHFGEIVRRFHRALSRSLPHLDDRDLTWRFHFMIGAMVHVIADPAKLVRLSGGLCDPKDIEAVTNQLVTFLAAGFRSASPKAGRDTDAGGPIVE